MKPVALLTNDDGIGSGLFQALVMAMAAHFEIRIAAPASERSWIGRAFSRHRRIAIESSEVCGYPAWKIDGTPSDCVNLALGELFAQDPSKPQIVVSGINIGYNTGIPLLLSSGTVAGAIEGANWGLPAVAASQQLNRQYYMELTASGGLVPVELRETLEHSARHAADYALALLNSSESGVTSDLIVHNLNYPRMMTPSTPTVETVPAPVRLGCLFKRQLNGEFAFDFSMEEEPSPGELTDRQALEDGKISLSVLNFSSIGRSNSRISH